MRSLAALQHTLSRELADAGGSSSALVVDASSGRILFAHDATTPRLPASVEKLYTTSAALFDLGWGARFATSLEGVGTLRNGVFSGRLYLRGGGDPTFGDAHFDNVAYGGGATVQALLAHLHAAGVNVISGAILGDASIFDNLAGGPDTGGRADLETEGELSGLSYDAGFTNGSETQLQPHPALWAAQALASVAPREGITIARGTRIGTAVTPATATVLARVLSPNVGTLLRLTNAPSDNFFAEMLDKQLAARFGTVASTGAGAAVVTRTTATRLGLSLRTDDGSGLSRYDRTTALNVVELLEEMEPSPSFDNSLAVAGQSGTMIDEMRHTPAADNCRGKTGSLHDVANLVGYCTAANGDRLVFAFLENGLSDATYGHLTEDAMGEALADFSARAGGPPAPPLPKPDAGATIAAGPAPGPSS